MSCLAGCSGGTSAPPLAAMQGAQAASVLHAASVGSQAATNVVVNGGFETGDLSGWTTVGQSTGAPKISTSAHSGSYAAFMGTTKAPEISGYVGLEQQVTIPASATLSFFVKGVSDDTASYAYEEVDLRNASGTIVDTCYHGLLDTTTYQAESCNLSSFAGQTLTLFVGISGNGYASTYVDAWYDDVAIVGSGTAAPSPTASPTPAPTAAPSSTASAKPTASPTPTAAPTASPKPTATPTVKPTATPTAAPTATGAPSGVAVDPATFTVVSESAFESVITNGKNIRFSTYVLSPTSTLEAALVNAAKAGATVVVDLPSDSYVMTLGSVYQEDQQSAANIQAAGGTVLWDAGTQTPNNEPLHAKLAIVDGTAYLDGRNWDASDVILSETGSADLTAIANALALNPTDSPYLDTVKQDALSLETTFIGNAAGTTISYMTESFGAGNVANALIARAQAGATVHVIVLKSDTSSSSDTVLTQLKNAGADVELNPGSGSEKMAIIGSYAWFGSSNSTSGAAYQIDWGMVTGQSSVISTLQQNFNAVLATCTKY